MQQKIIILDFGSQTTQLIGRRVRELDTFCEILPYNKFPKEDPSVIGVILSGSPFSVYDKEAFKIDLDEIRGKYPILGICYGAQFMSYTLGGNVEPAGTREYGRANLASFDKENPLFKGFEEHSQVWMSHGDTITKLPEGFKVIASTDKVVNAAYQAEGEPLWGVQFHPEVSFRTGNAVAEKLCSGHLRQQAGLECGFVRRHYGGRVESAVGRRPGDSRIERWCGFFRGRSVAEQGYR